MEYEAFGVKAIIVAGDELILSHSSLPFSLARRGETPQKCFKRMVRELTGDKCSRFRSLPYVGRRSVMEFDESIRSGWAPGLKTIPVYGFCCTVEGMGGMEKNGRAVPMELALSEEDKKLLDIFTTKQEVNN